MQGLYFAAIRQLRALLEAMQRKTSSFFWGLLGRGKLSPLSASSKSVNGPINASSESAKGQKEWKKVARY